MTKQVYIIGIGGIGTSAIARYYKHMGYKVSGSDGVESELTNTLIQEGIDVFIGADEKRITKEINLVIHTEAIPIDNPEISKARKIGLTTLTYAEALGEVTKGNKLIAIAGTHGKSTTTALTSLVLQNSEEKFSSIVGTLLKEFGGKNFYTNSTEVGDFFAIEACEYKRHFLNYNPSVAVITNIEVDHLDYYKDESDYVSAFDEFIGKVIPGGFVILNGKDTNSMRLLGKRKDVNYIQVFREFFKLGEEKIFFPKLHMQVPGEHILFDAKVAYIIGHMIGIQDHNIVDALEAYNGVWRRMEIVGETQGKNILMSDYGHHPTEIKLTLTSLKEKYPNKKILTIFQPHQYNRTLELLDGFKTCFGNTDTLIIPDIYESRDSEEDKAKINSEKLSQLIVHHDVQDGKGLDNTLKEILMFDTLHQDAIILLMGAGNVDDLRFKIRAK